jgi:hypothetical protein
MIGSFGDTLGLFKTQGRAVFKKSISVFGREILERKPCRK